MGVKHCWLRDAASPLPNGTTRLPILGRVRRFVSKWFWRGTGLIRGRLGDARERATGCARARQGCQVLAYFQFKSEFPVHSYLAAGLWHIGSKPTVFNSHNRGSFGTEGLKRTAITTIQVLVQKLSYCDEVHYFL